MQTSQPCFLDQLKPSRREMRAQQKDTFAAGRFRPAGSFQAVASDSRGASRKRKEPNTETIRAGEFALNLTSVHEPHWPIALRLQEGHTYSVEFWEAEDIPAVVSMLPLDQTVDGRFIFFGIARPSRGRDEIDGRLRFNGLVGVWTDGLMLRAPSGAEHNQLKPMAVYRVAVLDKGVVPQS